MAADAPSLLTVKEAAAYTRMSESTVRKWVDDAVLPVIRLGQKGRRGHIRIRRADLDAFLAAATTGGDGLVVVKPKPARDVDAIPRSAYRHLKL